MAGPFRARVRAFGAMTLLLLLPGACGDPAGDTAAPADESPDGAADGEAPATGAAAPAENLTDGCVDDFAEGTDYFPEKASFDEASGVTVSYEGHYKVVDVALPGADAPVRTVLVQCGTPAPALEGDLEGAQLVDVPVGEVITLTTTNLPHFAELEAVDSLVGVGNADFVATPEVVAAVEEGDVGEYADASDLPDLERILDREPDLLMMDGFGEEILDDAARFSDAGVPAVLTADFDEHTLLGRAEWLKHTALYLNAEDAAERRFDDIAAAYEDVVAAAGAADEEPSVLVNTPFEGTWYTPGGASYLAHAIDDAGGEYVFADDDSTGSLELDLETVLDRAHDADVWIQAGSVHGTLDDLLAQDERFAQFDAFAEGDVWAWDAWTTPGGGNAVFEVAYTRADLFLADLVEILHPGLLDDHELVFYGPVPAGG